MAAGCGAGRDTETDKERSTPYLASVSAGSVAVRAIRVVLSDTGTSSNASATTPQAYLIATLVNRSRSGQTESLTGATVAGSAVTPVGGSTAAISLPPQQVVQIGDPDLGFTGPALGVGALQQGLATGTTTTVTFTFQTSGTVSVQVPVMTSSDVGTTASAAPVPIS